MMKGIKEMIKSLKEVWEILDWKQRAKLLVAFPIVLFILAPLSCLGNLADRLMDGLGNWIQPRPRFIIALEEHDDD